MSLASPTIVLLPKDAEKPEGVKQTDWNLLLNVGLPRKMLIYAGGFKRPSQISFEALAEGLAWMPDYLSAKCRRPIEDARKWGKHWLLGEFTYEGGAASQYMLNGASGAIESIIAENDNQQLTPVNSDLQTLRASLELWMNMASGGAKGLKLALKSADPLAWKAMGEWRGIVENMRVEKVDFE